MWQSCAALTLTRRRWFWEVSRSHDSMSWSQTVRYTLRILQVLVAATRQKLSTPWPEKPRHHQRRRKRIAVSKSISAFLENECSITATPIAFSSYSLERKGAERTPEYPDCCTYVSMHMCGADRELSRVAVYRLELVANGARMLLTVKATRRCRTESHCDCNSSSRSAFT